MTLSGSHQPFRADQRTVLGEEILVPGSVSNLGPGFDAISVAVQLYLRVRVIEVRRDGRADVACEFTAGAPAAENRIATAFAEACRALSVVAPSVHITVDSAIPLRAGLGSSGAATIAGLLLFERVTHVRPPDGWLALATQIEGHPDNAAASLLGGLAISCQHDDGRVTARQLPWPDAVCLVAAIPDVELPTSVARQILPPQIPLRDAVFNLQHALLLVDALRHADLDGIREALADRWHQPVRGSLVPGLREALVLRTPGLLGVCLSGSGPSIVAFTTPAEQPSVAESLAALYSRLGVRCRVLPLAVHQPAVPAAMPSSDLR